MADKNTCVIPIPESTPGGSANLRQVVIATVPAWPGPNEAVPVEDAPGW
jgi:hypothetical protein